MVNWVNEMVGVNGVNKVNIVNRMNGGWIRLIG